MNAFLGRVPIRGMGQNAPPWSPEREIKKKEQECYFLRLTYNSALGKYYQEDTPAEYYDEILEPARLELNTCIAELQELMDTESYGPRIPATFVRAQFQLPTEPATIEPSTPEPVTPEPETATSVPWPSEIPKPTTAAIPPTEEPTLPTEEPSAEETGVTKAEDCDPLKGEFFDSSTGQCRGSIKSGFGIPSGIIGPATTSAASFMSGVRLGPVPLRAGRF